MADNGSGKKGKGLEVSEYSTFRIFAQDGEDLSELASKLGITIAELFRQECAPIIRGKLLQKMEERLRDLRARR